MYSNLWPQMGWLPTQRKPHLLYSTKEKARNSVNNLILEHMHKSNFFNLRVSGKEELSALTSANMDILNVGLDVCDIFE